MLVSPELHMCLLHLPAGSASVEGKVEPHERKPHADRLCRRTGVLSGISVDGLLMKEVPARSFRVVSRQVRGRRRSTLATPGTVVRPRWCQRLNTNRTTGTPIRSCVPRCPAFFPVRTQLTRVALSMSGHTAFRFPRGPRQLAATSITRSLRNGRTPTFPIAGLRPLSGGLSATSRSEAAMRTPSASRLHQTYVNASGRGRLVLWATGGAVGLDR